MAVAIDALATALAARKGRRAWPRSSAPRKGETVVALPPVWAAMDEAGVSNSELAPGSA